MLSHAAAGSEQIALMFFLVTQSLVFVYVAGIGVFLHSIDMIPQKPIFGA